MNICFFSNASGRWMEFLAYKGFQLPDFFQAWHLIVRISNIRLYIKASVEHATKVLDSNGFSAIRIIASTEYSRPLVIGEKKT